MSNFLASADGLNTAFTERRVYWGSILFFITLIAIEVIDFVSIDDRLGTNEQVNAGTSPPVEVTSEMENLFGERVIPAIWRAPDPTVVQERVVADGILWRGEAPSSYALLSIRDVTKLLRVGDALLDGSLVVDISSDSVLLFRHGRQQRIRTFEHALDLSYNPFEKIATTGRPMPTYVDTQWESLQTPSEILSALGNRHAATYRGIPAVPSSVKPRRRLENPMDDPRLKMLRANAEAHLPKVD